MRGQIVQGKSLLSTLFCYLATIFRQYLIFFSFFKQGKGPRKNVPLAMVNLGSCLQTKGKLLTHLHHPMSSQGYHALSCNQNIFILGDSIFWHLVVPMNNSTFMRNCSLVQCRSNKSSLKYSYSMILPIFFSFITIYEYANEIIVHKIIG